MVGIEIEVNGDRLNTSLPGPGFRQPVVVGVEPDAVAQAGGSEEAEVDGRVVVAAVAQ